MSPRRRSRPVALAMLLGLVATIGCRHVDRAADGPDPSRARGGAAMDGRQVADIQYALGRSLEKQGEPDRAIVAYLEAIRRDQGRADAYLRLAVLHDRQGRFVESEDLYRRAIEASPGDPEVFCDRGYSLYLQRRWGEAEMILRQAIALRPNLARARTNLGLVLAHNERPDEALAEFRRAGCSPADAHLNLAFALSTDGRLSEARDQARLALQAEPASGAARERLQELDVLLAAHPAAAPASATRDGEALRASAAPE